MTSSFDIQGGDFNASPGVLFDSICCILCRWLGPFCRCWFPWLWVALLEIGSSFVEFNGFSVLFVFTFLLLFCGIFPEPDSSIGEYGDVSDELYILMLPFLCICLFLS